ncbi:ead/Ea22-like family protein [Enterobacter roggenkampii]|nr:ead/Ea22-like family protein [Enterobacter roggenkampii]
MSVKRYEWVACDEHSCHCDVVESAEGDMVDYEDYAALEARCAALAAENAGMKAACGGDGSYRDCPACAHSEYIEAPETPATDAFLAEVRAQAHKEGAHFVANRMLAAWEAGFIDDTAKNAADIARMILTSTEFMADAPEGDFDRSFADGVLEDIAAQLRKGTQS